MINAEVKYLAYLAVASFALSILLQVSKVSATSHSTGQPQSHSHCTIVLTSSRSSHNDVELIGIRLVRKVTRQFIHDGKQPLIIQLSSPKCFSILSPKAMDTFQRISGSAEYHIFSINAHHQWHQSCLAHLPEGYGPGVDVLECMIILGLDRYPELADGLVLCNPDREGAIGLIAEDPTRDQDLVRHAGRT